MEDAKRLRDLIASGHVAWKTSPESSAETFAEVLVVEEYHATDPCQKASSLCCRNGQTHLTGLLHFPHLSVLICLSETRSHLLSRLQAF